MRVPRFLQWIMALFVCIVFVRAINGVGPLSVTDLLVDIQGIEFDMQHIAELVSLLRDGKLSDTLHEWDYTLTGLDGFFINLGKTLTSFFAMWAKLIGSIVMSVWNIGLSVINLFLQLLALVCNVLGIRLNI